MIALSFSGDPIAKKRHRTTRHGSYNPQSEVEAAVKWEARAQYKDNQKTGALSMSVMAYFSRPKSHYGTGRNSGKLKPSAPKHHTQLPDADNLAKFYADALNGIAYLDDRQVVNIHVHKVWTVGPASVHITITEIT